jgi:hypothetical protein
MYFINSKKMSPCSLISKLSIMVPIALIVAFTKKNHDEHFEDNKLNI